MSHFEKQMAHLETLMRPAMKELHQNTSKPLITDVCPEHWNNIIIFGLCWRHNADGSLKSTFTKKV